MHVFGRLQSLICTIAIIACIPCVPVAADDDNELREWAEAQLTREPFHHSIGPFKAVIESDYPSFMSDREYAELKREVEGRAEHPDRYQYEIETRRRTLGPDRRRVTLWYGGENHWRVNHDDLFESHPGLAIAYDIGRSSGRHWHYVPVPGQRHIQVSRIDDPPVRPRLSIIEAGQITLLTLCDAIDGPLADRYAISVQITKTSSRGQNFSLVLLAGDKDSLEISGIQPGDSTTRRITRYIRHSTSAPGLDGRSFTIDEWETHPLFEREIARRIVTRSKQGEVREITRIVSIEPVSKSTLDEACSLPSRDGSDPIRGPVEPGESIEWIDFQSTRGTSRTVAGSTQGSPRDLGATQIGWWSLNRLGLTLLVGLLTGLVVLRVLRFIRK